MSKAGDVAIVAALINREGGKPGHSLHSWRCEDEVRYPGCCTCVEDLATEIVAAVGK